MTRIQMITAGSFALLSFSSPSPNYAQTMTAPSQTVSSSNGSSVAGTMPSKSRAGTDNTAIRPFKFTASEAQLADLKSRIAATRWPSKELVADQSQGVQLATIQKLASYWANNYDWRKAEAKLNSYPQFVTNIDGVDIHFIQVKSKEKNALPIIVTHGWPGSILEQLKIIDPLTNPTAYGGTAADAFDVVIPSLPGHGFSAEPTTQGWDPIRIAKAWAVLMDRLGYKRYVAQGGDWGNAVTEQLALLQPPGLIGIHTNMPATLSPEISQGVQSGESAPEGLSADEKKAYDILVHFFATGTAYAAEMANRPQTLYGVVDSPVGLAAWMLDHDEKSYELTARAFTGDPGGLSRDDVLDNVTHYWLTSSGISSARLYWESKLGFFDIKGVELPVGVTVFPDELYPAPRSWAEKAYPKLIHFNEVDEGGHFAAWEQPQTFSEEMRATFRSLR